MKKLNGFTTKIALLAFSFASAMSFSQTVVNTPFSGAPTSWTVPNCVTSITITVAGAQGGNALDGPGSTGSTGTSIPGGLGAVITATIPVNPGDIIGMTVGGQGGIGTAGFNGGGTGQFSSDGQLVNGSAGGGGSTNVTINGVPIIIAAGGGGAGGGSWSFSPENNVGGAGGCANGVAPSPGSPWIGTGGGGGTQFGPGAGGPPWAGVPTGGFPGVGGTGGAGGIWNTAPGGGGGGGYFGGGGGGNDGCCTGANGAAGGGGGSSLIPGGAGCTQGSNTGNGYVTISYTGGSSTASLSPVAICEGSTTTLTLSGSVGAFNWEESTDGGVTWTTIAGATTSPYVTGPLNQTTCFRANEPAGGCAGTPYSNVVCCTVSPMPAPNAGLDDSLCFVAGTGYVLQGTSSGGTTTWVMTLGPLGTPGPPAAVYTPNANNLNASAAVNYPGMYTFTLSEVDPTGLCPNAVDQVNILYAQESHTTALVHPTCFGYADGSVTVTSTGIPGAVEYSIDGGITYQASNVFSGLAAGTYTIISRDLVGCTAQTMVDLIDPPLVVVSVSNDTTVCENGTATVSASATGGTSYTYTWSHTANTGPSQTVSPTVPVTIDVFATNELGCVSAPLSIDISLYAPISLVITPNDSVCPGYASSMTVTPSGGHLGYSYSWTANAAPFAGAGATISMNPTVQTQYCVTVADGCETTPKTICSNVIMREVPNPIFTSDTTEGCVPTEIVFTNLTPAYLVDSVTWEIDGVIYHDLTTLTHTFTEVGMYDVFLEVYTQYGCFNSMTADNYITVHGNPHAMFYANPNPTTVFNTEVNLNNVSSAGLNTFEWLVPGANPGTSVLESPTVMYPDGVQNTYPVTLIVTNEFNCTDTVTSFVTVLSDILIYVPNVFTPDGDEFNETWRVYMDGIDIYDYHMTVFNRWGEVVWESYNLLGEWDGTYGSTQAKSGTYVWVIEAKDLFSDKKLEWRGHVTVLK